MKKFIKTFMLIIMILPIASVFISCKQKGYNLKNLSSDFYSIADLNSNIKLNDGKFEFDYSSYKKLSSAVTSIEPYSQLKNYNYVLNNMMEFSFGYIQACSDNSITKDSTLKNNLEGDLVGLKNAYANVNQSIDELGHTLTVSSSNIVSKSCLALYEDLLKDYETLFVCATNFNNSLANLYFNHVLKTSNPDIYALGKENFDSTIVVQRLDARIKYQVSVLSQCFAEMYLFGETFAHEVANSEQVVRLSEFNYLENVKNINVEYNVESAIERANNESNIDSFYEYAVVAQIYQSIIDDEISQFIYAIKSIDYLTIQNNEEASAHDIMCYDIISSSSSLFIEYNNKALKHMVNIIT